MGSRSRVRPRSGGRRKVRIGVAEVEVRDGQRRRGYRPPAPHREHEPVAVAERPRGVEDLHRPPAERDFAFIRAAEIVRTAPAVSISSHVASRTH